MLFTLMGEEFLCRWMLCLLRRIGHWSWDEFEIAAGLAFPLARS